ncbi:hypothetical protein SAMN05443634_11064 [Chishuiella changwenlii]|uniref:Uncharacterized protein n=1 Tax=Chishuiella changwenlii TaxID=1434701 RepID=A0A1M7B6K5_9FLAO|nr:hypothetical protein [Chishuiella changwenlii]GGE95995.1 hypothetical protein GCM10010984_11880 [Chishuiella changwenlii]SHL50612.1 hypothetical protein SAMN05443634_11064 [Chishuiella changwenlii]
MSTKKELQNRIDQFDEDQLKENGVFGIFTYGGDSSENYIKANKDGLELYALRLLKIARDLEDTLPDNNENDIWFDKENWIDENSEVFINYVEQIVDKQKDIEGQQNTKFSDNLALYGCIFILMFLLFSILVGVSTMFGWFFN